MTLSHHPQDSLHQRLSHPTLAEPNQEDVIHHDSTEPYRTFSYSSAGHRGGSSYDEPSCTGSVHAQQSGHHHKRPALEKCLGSLLFARSTLLGSGCKHRGVHRL